MDLVRVAARIAEDEESPFYAEGDNISDDYKEWLQEIVSKHYGSGSYFRFDEQPFDMSRSFKDDDNINGHTNHLGLWTYMKPRRDHFGFGSPYITVFRGNGKVLNTGTFSDADAEKILEEATKKFGPEQIAKWAAESKKQQDAFLAEIERLREEGESDFGDLEEMIEESRQYREETPIGKIEVLAAGFAATQGNRREGLSKFYVDLGYEIIEDPIGAIDEWRDTALGLTPNAMEIVERYHFEGDASWMDEF